MMNEKDIWDLFKRTGEIKYYIMYRNIIDGKLDKGGNKKN